MTGREVPRGDTGFLAVARAKDATTIELPTVLRDRLAAMKVHERQACHEVIEHVLDVYDDLVSSVAMSPSLVAQPLSGRASSTAS